MAGLKLAGFGRPPHTFLSISPAILFAASESEYILKDNTSSKRVALKTEHNAARSAKRTRYRGDESQMPAYHKEERVAMQREVAKRDARLKVHTQKRVVMEKEIADQDAQLEVLIEDNADKNEQSSAQQEDPEKLKTTHQAEKEDLQAPMQVAKPKAEGLQTQRDNEQQERAAEQKQWQASMSKTDAQHTYLLSEEQKSRAQDKQHWENLAKAADQKYDELAITLDAERVARGEEQRNAAEALETAVAQKSGEYEMRLQQERAYRKRAERERDELKARMALLESQAAMHSSTVSTKDDDIVALKREHDVRVQQECEARVHVEKERDDLKARATLLTSRATAHESIISTKDHEIATLKREQKCTTLSAQSRERALHRQETLRAKEERNHALDQVARARDELVATQKHSTKEQAALQATQSKASSDRKELAKAHRDRAAAQVQCQNQYRMHGLSKQRHFEAMGAEKKKTAEAEKRANAAEAKLKQYESNGGAGGQPAGNASSGVEDTLIRFTEPTSRLTASTTTTTTSPRQR